MPRKFSRAFAFFCSLVFCVFSQTNIALSQRQKSDVGKTITIKTEPKTIVWLDEVRRGMTGDNGALELKGVTAKRHSLRVRAKGFKEITLAIAPPIRNEIVVKLMQTTDEAELLFQKAEEERDKAKTQEEKQSVVELYRRALKLRPKFSAANLGLARALSALDDFEAALDAVEAARKSRPIYPEASAVEGRIYRSMSDDANAAESFQRAIREARGFQPEAHTGLAFIYGDNAEYEDAIAELKIALVQLSDTEPILYLKLAEYYEKIEKYKDALAAYEKFLEIAPNYKEAPAIKSIVEQMRREKNQ
jgi:tetratricopeptide (TPR) repeat protein